MLKALKGKRERIVHFEITYVSRH